MKYIYYSAQTAMQKAWKYGSITVTCLIKSDSTKLLLMTKNIEEYKENNKRTLFN